MIPESVSMKRSATTSKGKTLKASDFVEWRRGVRIMQ